MKSVPGSPRGNHLPARSLPCLILTGTKPHCSALPLWFTLPSISWPESLPLTDLTLLICTVCSRLVIARQVPDLHDCTSTCYAARFLTEQSFGSYYQPPLAVRVFSLLKRGNTSQNFIHPKQHQLGYSIFPAQPRIMAPAEPGADLFAIQPTPTSADELLGLSSNHVNATAAAALTHAFPPLTTPWATPQSCTWTYIVDNPGQTAGHGAVAWLDLEPIPGASTLSCYPDGMFSYGFTGTFSPGTCPGGWTTATLYSQPDKTESSATTAVCCS